MPDRAKDMATCQRDASRFYQTYHAISPDDPSSRYLIGCMATKGYDFTISPAACSSAHPLPTQAACYEPSNWVIWLIDRIYAEWNQLA